MKALIASAIAALLVQPVAFFLWFVLPGLIGGGSVTIAEIEHMSLLVVIVAAMHLLCIGLPVFYLLKATGRLGWINFGLAGFVVGTLLVAVLSVPVDTDSGYSAGGNWHGQYHDFFVEGKATRWAWIVYFETVGAFGLHGLAAAWSFLATWRALQAVPKAPDLHLPS